jgi:hypothetical protein
MYFLLQRAPSVSVQPTQWSEAGHPCYTSCCHPPSVLRPLTFVRLFLSCSLRPLLSVPSRPPVPSHETSLSLVTHGKDQLSFPMCSFTVMLRFVPNHPLIRGCCHQVNCLSGTWNRPPPTTTTRPVSLSLSLSLCAALIRLFLFSGALICAEA